MVGRPRKIYKPGEEPAILHIVLTQEIKNLIPEGANISDEVRKYILFKYGDPKKGELSELKKQRDKLSTELAIINSKIAQLEKEIEEQERLNTYIRMKNLYSIWKFWSIAQESAKRGYVTFTNPDKVESVFGIKFDYRKFEKDIRQKEIQSYHISTFEQAVELSKKYDVKYLGNGLNEEEEFQKFLKFYENYKKEVKV
ncbi:MAG: hypothetical protein ACP5IB_09000 [Thermoplasmata archaeon]